MINAIRKVMAGDRYLSKDVAHNLATQSLPSYHESPFSKLSRESPK
jgi:DNA-binding NarL/FixJ family response regulator